MGNDANDLEIWFRSHQGRLIQKWNHYFQAYEQHFSRFRNQEVTVLEIGVAHGGSIEMWKHYFGPELRYYGVDIDPSCRMFEEPGVEIFIGSQSDPDFLREVAAKIPDVDILIDDGGHTMRQQHVTFEALFDKVKNGGVYLCEDLHTSYWLEYGGGHNRHGSFIETAKSLVDSLNAFHSQQRSFGPDAYTRSITSLHFYDSMLFIEKNERTAPEEEWRGEHSFASVSAPLNMATLVRNRAVREMKRMLRAVGARDFTTG